MGKLARERVFDELCKLLPLVNADDLQQWSPILTQVLPELAPTVGFQQRSPHHAYDLFTHTAHVVQAVPPVLALRLAALLHDIGKPATFYLDENGRGHFPGHAKVGAEMANDALLRLKAPTALRQQVVRLIEWHMTPLEPDKRILRRRLGKLGTDGTRQLLALQQADFGSKGTNEASDTFDRIAQLLRELEEEAACLTVRDLAVSGNDLLALGFAPGKKLGACLDALLAQVQDELLPNEREALLKAAAGFLK
jgi:tRNA nucleotidyltransferase (CCA-adding enzyme)